MYTYISVIFKCIEFIFIGRLHANRLHLTRFILYKTTQYIILNYYSKLLTVMGTRERDHIRCAV